jgi:hypothetical protein
VGPCGGSRTAATTIIDRCTSSHAVGIVSFCPYSAFFDTTAATHHSPMMYRIGGRGTTTHSALRLRSRQLLFLTSLGRHCRLSGILSYIFLRRTQPTTTPQRPKQPTTAAMVPNSRRRRIQQSPIMLADCRMWRHRE